VTSSTTSSFNSAHVRGEAMGVLSALTTGVCLEFVPDRLSIELPAVQDKQYRYLISDIYIALAI
jgi:hypothetical protein